MKDMAWPTVGTVMAECAQVGLMIASKAAVSKGMSNLIFFFYSNAFAAVLLLRASLLYHRRTQLPHLSAISLVSQFFLLGLLGYSRFSVGFSSYALESYTAHGRLEMDSGGQDPATILGQAMSGSSCWSGCGVTAAMVLVELLDQGLSTVSKAAMTGGMSNFVFVLYSNSLATFILLPASLLFYRRRSIPKIRPAFIFRIYLQGLLGCILQLFKYIGIGYSSPTLSSTMSDLTPAFTFILAVVSRMEKLELRVQSSHAKLIGTAVSIAVALTVTLFKGAPIIGNAPPTIQQHLLAPQSSWIMGAIFLASGALVRSLLYIVQTWIIRDYPAVLVVALGSCLSTAINSGAVALILERDPSAWRLKPGIELITVVYSAVFVVAIRHVAHSWACRMKGPLYVSMFKPLGMVFAIVMGVSLLKDTLYLGSVVGAVIIAVGFYAVVWGKAQEEKIVCQLYETDRTPLLNTKVEL